MNTGQAATARLRANQLSYSGSERNVAEWILADPRRMLTMSMSDVARECGVSDTTVLRLARRAGFRGYTDLKLALALDVARPGELIHGAVGPGDDTPTVLGKITNANVQALRDTEAMTEPRGIDEIVSVLEAARRVSVVGVGSSGILGQLLYQRLARLGIRADAPVDGQLQLMHATTLGEGDLLFAISHSGATKDVLAIAERARANGTTVVALTGNASSPLAHLSDHILLAVTTETRSDPIGVLIAALSLIEMLVVTYSLRHADTANELEQRFVDAIIPKTM